MLKKILLTSTILAMSSLPAFAEGLYVEGQLGFSAIADFDTNTYSGSGNGFTATNLKATLDYDNAFTYGVEVGAKEIGRASCRERV